MKDIIEEIKIYEGFRGEVYKDTLGYETVGYGTKMPLNKEEASFLLIYRLEKISRELEKKLLFYKLLAPQKQKIILHMGYQLGVHGLLKFKKMLLALQEQDYKKAAYEMRASKWYVQTPNRAKYLINKMYKPENNTSI